MKNLAIKILIFTLFLIFVNISCQKEISDKYDPISSDIKAAQAWYQKNKPVKVGIGFESGKSVKVNIKPNWDQTYIEDHKEFKTVEAVISIQGGFGFANLQNKEAYEKTGNFNYMLSLTRMIFLTEKKTKKTIGFLMTIIPDKDYFDSTNFKSFSSTYGNLQTGFCGYIFYHTLEGNFNNGWKFCNGKIIKTVKESKNKYPELASKYTICWTQDIQFWIQICWDWWTGTTDFLTYRNTTCDTPILSDPIQITECAYIADDNNPGSVIGGYLEPAQQSNTPTIDLIYDQLSTLSQDQKSRLETAIYSFKNLNPIFAQIWNGLISNGAKILFRIGPTPDQHPASISYNGDTITFRDADCILEEFLQEELIHNYQKKHYGVGFQSIIRNFEFEAKILEDVAKAKYNPSGGSFYGTWHFSSQMDMTTYDSWIWDLAGGLEFNISTFRTLCQVWSYPFPPNNYYDQNMVPDILYDFFSSIIN